MLQQHFSRKIKDLPLDGTYKGYRSKRQDLTWLVHTRPDFATDVNLAAQVTESKGERKHVLEINNLVRYVNRTAHRGIRQHKLDADTMVLKVFTDSSFANTPDLKLKLGYLIALVEASGKEKMPHLASHKSRRVTKYVIGGKVLAFANGLDFGYLLRHDLEQNIKKRTNDV